jgi:putative inorganic carbon (HCO3(-)) transporter
VTSPLLIQPVDNASRPRSWLRRVAWCEPFWVSVIGLLLLLPPRFLPAPLEMFIAAGRAWLVLLLLIGWPVRRMAYGYFTRRTPLDWPLLLLILWLPVNLLASADQALSWEATGYLMFGIALYFSLLNWPPAQRQPQIVAWLLLTLGVGLALAAPLLSELATGKLFRIQSLEQLFQQAASQVPGNVNANRVAGTLVLIAPLAAALFLRRDWSPRRWQPVLCGLAALLMLVVLVMTQSRNAYLAIAIGVAVILLLRWPRLMFVLPVVILMGAIVMWRIGPQAIVDALPAGGALSGLDGRLELWSRAWYALNDFTFTGIGIGTFERVIPVLYPLFSVGPDVQITHAHNLFLQVGVDLGVPGLIAYLALLINLLVMLGKALRRRADALDWTLAAGALGGVVAMLIHGLFDAPVWGVKPAFIPWLLIALSMLVSLRSVNRWQPNEAPSP